MTTKADAPTSSAAASAAAAAAVAAPSYPPSYPSGVLVLAAAQHLAPVVTQLREWRRLKAGRNVTCFAARHFAELVSGAWADSVASNKECDGETQRTGKGDQEGNVASEPCLVASCVRLYEVAQGEEGEGSLDGSQLPHEDFEMVTVGGCAAAQRLLSLLSVPLSERHDDDAAQLAASTTTTAASSTWPAYVAVHVSGELSEAALLSLLTAASPTHSEGGDVPSPASSDRQLAGPTTTPPPVAYIRGVRRYHRVCCPDLSTLPSALAALRRSAFLGKPASASGRDTPSSSGQRETSAERGGASCRAAASSSPSITFSELFGGIGMFRTALERVGGRAAFAVEFAPPAQMVYALNHGCWHDCPATLRLPNERVDGAPNPDALAGDRSPSLLVGDITEIPSLFFPHHDVLTGGFPCQSFAKAGAAAGLNAAKGWLFYEVTRVLAHAQPRAFLLENVEHLVELEAGAQLQEILRRLRHPAATEGVVTVSSTSAHGTPDAGNSGCGRALEYAVEHVVVDGGLLTPQTRRRVYFIGVRREDAARPTPARDEPSCPADTAASVASVSVSDVVADALGRLRDAAASAPYRSVADLLVAPSTADAALSHNHVRCQDREEASSSITQDGAGLQLTPAQWEAVQRSHTFRQNPMWRVCDVEGKARTLLGSYRTSYQLYSEFVPYAPHRPLQEVHAWLQMAAAGDERDSCGESSLRRNENGKGEAAASEPATATPAALPPLRFFSIRECARLQGIADTFSFPHDTTSLSLTATEEGQRESPIPAAVLRQVPPGAVYKLIGNAVNPRVVECLAGALVSCLESERR